MSDNKDNGLTQEEKLAASAESGGRTAAKPGGASGIASGLQPGGMAPNTAALGGGLGSIATRGGSGGDAGPASGTTGMSGAATNDSSPGGALAGDDSPDSDKP